MTEKRIYKTAVYLRLSKGDGDVDGIEKAESNSISSQRMITGKFLEEHPELELVDTYIDDGYTGTNFKRPDLQRLLYDIDEGRIDCIVVKDLSRWGRERIGTGTFISKIFKEKGVRFIAITDHYDTLTASGSDTHLLMPIKALTNDNFSRDISVKVRSSFAVKKERGDYIAPAAPYGYKKDPDNVNHLLIDEPAAKIVRRIYAMKIDGYSANAIAGELTREGVQTPSQYFKEKGIGLFVSRKAACLRWSAKQVIRILTNQMYIGNMVQGKSSRVSYKVNKLVSKPEEEWDIVEGTHEAIVSRADFEIVQSLMKRDTMKSRSSPTSYLFGGLLYCGDCGSAMHRRKLPVSGGVHIYYVCGGYNKQEHMKTLCSRHRIDHEDLERIVLGSVNSMIRRLCRCDELARNLENMHISREEAVSHDQEIARLNEDLRKYRAMKSSLYQDLQEGLISQEQFELYRKDFTGRERWTQEAILRQKALIKDIYENGIAAEELLDHFRKDPQIRKLDHRLLVSLIDRILIYADKRVDIVYRYTDRMQKCVDILETAGKEAGYGKDKEQV